MKHHELQQTLTQLHEELAQTTDVDDVTRQALTTVLADIQRVMAGAADKRLSAASPEPALSSGLQAAIETLEVKHPRLTSVLQQLVDRLAEIGI